MNTFQYLVDRFDENSGAEMVSILRSYDIVPLTDEELACLVQTLRQAKTDTAIQIARFFFNFINDQRDGNGNFIDSNLPRTEINRVLARELLTNLFDYKRTPLEQRQSETLDFYRNQVSKKENIFYLQKLQSLYDQNHAISFAAKGKYKPKNYVTSIQESLKINPHDIRLLEEFAFAHLTLCIKNISKAASYEIAAMLYRKAIELGSQLAVVELNYMYTQKLATPIIQYTDQPTIQKEIADTEEIKPSAMVKAVHISSSEIAIESAPTQTEAAAEEDIPGMGIEEANRKLCNDISNKLDIVFQGEIKKNTLTKEAYLYFVEAGSVEAMMELAEMYDTGKFPVTNKNEEIFKLYQKASHKNYTPALNALAAMHTSNKVPGYSAAANSIEAEKYFLTAIGLGSINANIGLGQLYENTPPSTLLGRNNKEAAAEQYRVAVQRGNEIAMRYLGSLYFHHEIQAPGNTHDKQAAALFSKAAEKKDASSMMLLALMYIEGRATPPGNKKQEFIRMICESSELGCAWAIFNRAYLYRTGEISPPASMSKEQAAARDFMQVIKSQHEYPVFAAEAMAKMGFMYEHGELSPPSSAKGNKYLPAANLYQKAVQLGSLFAMNGLFHLYSKNLVPPPENQTIEAARDELAEKIRLLKAQETTSSQHHETRNLETTKTLSETEKEKIIEALWKDQQRELKEKRLKAQRAALNAQKKAQTGFGVISARYLEKKAKLDALKQSTKNHYSSHHDFTEVNLNQSLLDSIDDAADWETQKQKIKKTVGKKPSLFNQVRAACRKKDFETASTILAAVPLNQKDNYFYFAQAHYLSKSARHEFFSSTEKQQSSTVLKKYREALDILNKIPNKSIDIIILTAYCHIDLNEHAQAHDLLLDHLEKNPNSTKLLCALGCCHRSKGNIQQALDSYNEALAQDPADKWTLMGISLCYKIAHQFTNALDALKAIPSWEDNQEICLRIGYVYKYMGQHRNALEYYKKACDLDDTNIEAQCALALCYEKMGNYTLAIETLQHLENVQHHIEIRLSIARCLVLNRNPIEAIKLYEKILQDKPENNVALTGIAHSYKKLKEYANAIKAYKKVLTPENKDAYLGLADCYQQQSNTLQAIKTLQTFLEHESHVDVSLALGNYYTIIHEDEEAKKAYKEACDTNPFSHKAACAYCSCLIDQNENVEELLTEYLEQWPHVAGLHLLKALPYGTNRAQKALKAIIEAFPFEGQAYLALIKHYLIKQQVHEARQVEAECKQKFVGNHKFLNYIYGLIGNPKSNKSHRLIEQFIFEEDDGIDDSAPLCSQKTRLVEQREGSPNTQEMSHSVRHDVDIRHSEEPTRHPDEPIRHPEESIRHPEQREGSPNIQEMSHSVRHDVDIRHSEEPIRHPDEPIRHPEQREESPNTEEMSYFVQYEEPTNLFNEENYWSNLYDAIIRLSELPFSPYSAPYEYLQVNDLILHITNNGITIPQSLTRFIGLFIQLEQSQSIGKWWISNLFHLHHYALFEILNHILSPMPPQEVCQHLSIFAEYSIRWTSLPEPLQNALLNAVQLDLSLMSPEEMINTIWALVTLDLDWSTLNSDLSHAFVDHVYTHAEDVDQAALSDILYILSKINVPIESRLVQRLFEKFSVLELNQPQIVSMVHAYYCFKLDLADYAVQIENYESILQQDAPTRTDAQYDILEKIMAYLPSNVTLNEAVLLQGIYIFAVCEEQKIVLQIDDERFLTNKQQDELLSIAGYASIRINSQNFGVMPLSAQVNILQSIVQSLEFGKLPGEEYSGVLTVIDWQKPKTRVIATLPTFFQPVDRLEWIQTIKQTYSEAGINNLPAPAIIENVEADAVFENSKVALIFDHNETIPDNVNQVLSSNGYQVVRINVLKFNQFDFPIQLAYLACIIKVCENNMLGLLDFPEFLTVRTTTALPKTIWNDRFSYAKPEPFEKIRMILNNPASTAEEIARTFDTLNAWPEQQLLANKSELQLLLSTKMPKLTDQNMVKALELYSKLALKWDDFSLNTRACILLALKRSDQPNQITMLSSLRQLAFDSRTLSQALQDQLNDVIDQHAVPGYGQR